MVWAVRWTERRAADQAERWRARWQVFGVPVELNLTCPLTFWNRPIEQIIPFLISKFIASIYLSTTIGNAFLKVVNINYSNFSSLSKYDSSRFLSLTRQELLSQQGLVESVLDVRIGFCCRKFFFLCKAANPTLPRGFSCVSWLSPSLTRRKELRI